MRKWSERHKIPITYFFFAPSIEIEKVCLFSSHSFVDVSRSKAQQWESTILQWERQTDAKLFFSVEPKVNFQLECELIQFILSFSFGTYFKRLSAEDVEKFVN